MEQANMSLAKFKRAACWGKEELMNLSWVRPKKSL
jgi:hypothetical protein